MNNRRAFSRHTTAKRSAPWSLPTISVLLPVYQHAATVLQSARSVLDNDRYPLELIIIDDGSGPEVRASLDSLLDHPQVSYYYQENRGLAEALNKGARLASGQFLSWTSADNRFKPGALDKLADFLMSNPAVGLVYGNMELIDEAGAPLADNNYRPQNQATPGSNKLLLPIAAESLGADSDNFIGACHLLRTKVRSRVGDVDKELKGAEDFDYWLRCALNTVVAHIDSDEMLYEYRLHDDSLTERLGADVIKTEAEDVVAQFQQMRVQRSKTLALQRSESAKNKCSLPEKARVLGLEVNELYTQNLDNNFLWRALSGGECCVARVSGEKTHVNCLILPPLRRRPLLLRARDSDYRSIDSAQESDSRTVIFCSSNYGPQEKQAIVKLISENRNCTFALFCENAGERAFADDVNLSLTSNSNLRIIDVSNECIQGEDAYLHSLMYVLSNCDSLTALLPASLSVGALLSLRLQLAAAAHAGISLNLLCQEQPETPAADCSLEQELFASMLTSPHLVIELLKSEVDYGASKVTLSTDTTPYNQCTLDEWLASYSETEFEKLLIDVLIAKQVA